MASKVDASTKEEAEKLKAEVDASKKRIEELENDLGKIDLTRSSSFREQYDDKINTIGGRMVEILSKEGVEQPEAIGFVRQLLSEQKQSVRERLIDDMAPGLKGTLSALTIQIDEVVQKRNAAIENWKATTAALEETEARSKVAKITGKVDEIVTSAVDQVRKLGNPYFKQTDDEDWNKEVSDRQNTLKGILLTGDFEKIAPLVAEGLTAADLRVRYSKLLKSKRAVEKELEAVIKGAPRFEQRARSSSTSAPIDEGPHSVPLEDAITNDLLPPKR